MGWYVSSKARIAGRRAGMEAFFKPSAQSRRVELADEERALQDAIFGRVALALNILSWDTLSRLVQRVQAGEAAGLKELAERQGLIPPSERERLDALLRAKRAKLVDWDAVKEEERELLRALLSSGKLAPDDLESCLLEQERLRRLHLHIHLAEVLVQRGLLTLEDARSYLRPLRGEFRRCECCKISVQIEPGVPAESWKCPQCGGELKSLPFLQRVVPDMVIRNGRKEPC